MKTVQLFDFNFIPNYLKSFKGHKLKILRAATMNDFNLCYDKKYMANYGCPL